MKLDSQHRSLTESAYERIRDDILNGKIAVASALSEVDIARRLGISRTPVRHALGRLRQEGLLEIGPRRQSIVRGFTAEHREELLMIRQALEGAALRKACAIVTRDDLDPLRVTLLRQQRAAAEGWEEDFVQLDERFHLEIAQLAGMPILFDFLSQLRGFVRVMRLGTKRPPEHMAQVAAEHEEIIEALERREAQAAVDALTRHLERHDYASSEES